MNSITRKLAVIFLFIPMLGLASCASTGTGGSDGAVMGDLLTERAVFRALYQESSLTDDPILVGCIDGIVTLTGTVDDGVERQLAERITSAIAGVTKVNNNLRTRS